MASLIPIITATAVVCDFPFPSRTMSLSVSIIGRDIRVNIGGPATASRRAVSISIPVPVPMAIGMFSFPAIVVLSGYWWPWGKSSVAMPGRLTLVVRMRGPSTPRVAASIHTIPPKGVAVIESTIRPGSRIKYTAANRSTFWCGGQCSTSVLKFASVEFVALFKRGKIAGSGWQWSIAEVGMLEGINCVDSCLPVEFEEFLEQRDGS